MDTSITVRAGAFTQLVLRPSEPSDPLTRGCPDWPTCDRLAPDTTLEVAALQTLLLLSEPEMSAATRTAVPRCLMLSDTTVRDKPFPVSIPRMTDGTAIHPMRQCARRDPDKVYRAPDGAMAAALLLDLISSAGWKATWRLTIWQPPFWVSVVTCAQPVQGQLGLTGRLHRVWVD